jgi:Zn-dependent protease with chaperone function
MNFFAEQDRARRNTLVLVLLMGAAVLCLILMTSLATSLFFYIFQQPIDSPHLAVAIHTSWLEHFRQVLHSDLLYYTAAVVLAVVIGGSFYKTMQLGGNGRKVAEMLGGRLIPPNTGNPQERKILNIVEEMAIASGNPVPPVYVMEESAINAFAAGTDRRNAVIGITRGALSLLNRDELQGVIAHEFSHIHNGDMRLNLRLVALLHGILVIGLIGSLLVRTTSRRNSKNQGAQLGLGLVLLILGYCGVFFGNLIKAAVSRQREFLADASAVQFTRLPEGIANALKKIGGHGSHALLENPRATEYSHMYFGQGVSSFLGQLMATHPALTERIRKIQPRWDGKMIVPQLQAESAAETEPAKNEGGATAEQALGLVAAVATIGNPQPENLAAAQKFLHELPATLRDAAHEPFSCRALLYGLLLDKRDDGCRARQLDYLRQSGDSETLAVLEQLLPELDSLERANYLQLMELTIPALKSLSPAQYQAFKRDLIMLIKADAHISLLEWCLYRIITATCENRVVRGHLHLKQLTEAVSAMLLMACNSGRTTDLEAAFSAAAAHLPQPIAVPEAHQVSIQELDAALKQLEQLRPLEKPQFLKALAACIQVDGQVTDEEGELFRALADCLDCPVPLLRIS